MRLASTFATLLVLAAPAAARAQSDALLDHADDWFYAGGQLNAITQHHGDFTSPYSGDNSFRASSETATSRLLTVYLGARRADWEIAVHLESAGGRGLSDALGLAGFTNLDVVRNPTLGAAPYLARLMVRKIFALSPVRTAAAVSPLSLTPSVPVRRIEIRAGKFGIADFFDANSVLSDSHRQFTNWTVDNNGGYDYAADTRGYTYGVLAEFDSPRWSIRAAEALMPTVANGITLDTNLRRAHAENVESEIRFPRGAVLRTLAYENHANMGSYAEAIDAFTTGRDPRPDIEQHRLQGTMKYGAGLNGEQPIGTYMRVGARAGWNEGAHESFAYTEVNNTVSAGLDVAGTRWRRAADHLGVAFVSNGLSREHREYLRLGGSGFLLGDGTLRYRRETIVESYYTAGVWRGVSLSGGVQYVQNPGYNRDRGPVTVATARLHLDF
jgi:high affinity Mn2+ porin